MKDAINGKIVELLATEMTNEEKKAQLIDFIKTNEFDVPQDGLDRINFNVDAELLAKNEQKLDNPYLCIIMPWLCW